MNLAKYNIIEIASKLGLKNSSYDSNGEVGYSCFNHKAHKNGDKNASLHINKNTNVYHCKTCGVQGNSLELVKSVLQISSEEAYSWIEMNLDGKTPWKKKAPATKKPKKNNIQIRYLDGNPQRFAWLNLIKENVRNPIQSDIDTAKKKINKSYSLAGFKRLNIKILNNPYSIILPVVQNKHLVFNSNKDKTIILEGLTDYLTAVCHNLDKHFNIITRYNKTANFKLTKEILKTDIYILLDPDDDFENVYKKLELDSAEGDVFTVDFEKIFAVKDLSDFYNGGLETNILIDGLERIPITDHKDEFPFKFWFPTGKIDRMKFWEILEQNGFFWLRIDSMGSTKFSAELAEKNNNIIKFHTKNTIMNYSFRELLGGFPEMLSDTLTLNQVKENLVLHPNLFQAQRYQILPYEKIEYVNDTELKAYIPFKNCVLVIEKGEISTINYENLGGFMDSVKIIDRDFTLPENKDYQNYNFYKFMENICRVKKGAEIDSSRFNALKSIMGYLSTNYYPPTLRKAVVFTESDTSENPQGRTGKGLLMQAVNHCKLIDKNDGKNIVKGDKFAAQNVTPHTGIVFYDDVTKHFAFETLFSKITEGFEYEEKGEKKIKLDPAKSPKIVVSTNYTMPGDSGSFKARMFEMEIHNHYDYLYTPETDFGRFFENWNNERWNEFYYMMANFVQYFQHNKFITYKSDTLENKKLFTEAGGDIIAFLKGLLENEPNISMLFDDFYNDWLEFSDQNKKYYSKKKMVALFVSLNSKTGYCVKKTHKMVDRHRNYYAEITNIKENIKEKTENYEDMF